MMHEYGIYVWTAFGATIFVLGLNLFFALREINKTYRILKKNHES
jgi:heme exporter protein CcmD